MQKAPYVWPGKHQAYHRDTYPLPLIPDLIQQIEDAWVFTKFDVRWGYNIIRIKEGDQWKAAFKTCFGTFQPEVMYFGMSNSPPTFQMFMNMILATAQDKHRPLGMEILDYMDDILIPPRAPRPSKIIVLPCETFCRSFKTMTYSSNPKNVFGNHPA